MKDFIILVVITVFAVQVNIAQENGFTREEKKQLAEANYLFDMADYRSALAIYQEIYPSDSMDTDLNYRMGVAYFGLGGHEKFRAKKYLERAVDEEDGAYYYLGRIYHLEEDFSKAVKMYQKYQNSDHKEFDIEEVDRLIDISMRAKEMIENTQSVLITNIGGSVNSEFPDYVPLITADESVMIFTSRREGSTGGKKDPYGNYFEDVYISYKKGGRWMKPENMGPPINTETHDACVGLSADGSILIIYRTNEALTGGDLYWTKLEGENWTEPEKFEDPINTESYQEASATLSEDGITMYFSSNRPGGYGGKDIYRVIKFYNGDWSLPMNMGPTINTAFDDDAPFIHPDGKTLYFSSKGHKTMGGYDIFKSVLGDDGLWSEPENMKHPVNSVDDDIYFVLSADGKTGYYSSWKDDTYGSYDIYSMLLPTEEKLLTVIKGDVRSADGEAEPLQAKITLIDNENRKIQGVYNSNSANGKYIMVMEPNKDFKMIIEAAGYYPHTEYISFTTQDCFNEIYKAVKLEPKE